MRFAVLILSAGVALSALQAPSPWALDTPVGDTIRVEDLSGGNPCHFWTTLEQLARQVKVRIGFEQTLGCFPAGVMKQPYDASLSLDGLTPRQAFDRLLSQRPDYRWAEVDGVVVIRPATAWASHGSVLNAPVSAFAIADSHPHHALHTVFQLTQPSLFQEHTDLKLSSNSRRLDDPDATALIDAPVSVRFAGGTVLQALNAITRGFNGTWQVGYSEHGENLRSIWVILATLDWDGGTIMHPSVRFTLATSHR